MIKTISVWLQLEDGANKGKFVLQRRSTENNSFHFVCQATWSGKIDGSESIEQAVRRECEEELGEQFYKKFNFSLLKNLAEKNFKIGNDNCVAYNYFGTIKESALKMVKFHKEVMPELLFVDKNDILCRLDSKKDPKCNIVLFNDQYEILQLLLSNSFKANN